MTSVIQQLQEQYEARAAQARIVPAVAVEPTVKQRATRTYSGQPLARRRAWGVFFGQAGKAALSRPTLLGG